MLSYAIHTADTAPERSKPALQRLQQTLGIVPNLAATMAESPTLIDSFLGAFSTFHSGTFTRAQRQVLLLTNAVANRCSWAVAFHSTMALKEGVAPEAVMAIREGRLPQLSGYAALSDFTRTLVDKRGHAADADVAKFAAAGFRTDQVLEVIAGLAVSVLANYAGNLTNPSIEEPFRAQLWTARGTPTNDAEPESK